MDESRDYPYHNRLRETFTAPLTFDLVDGVTAMYAEAADRCRARFANPKLARLASAQDRYFLIEDLLARLPSRIQGCHSRSEPNSAQSAEHLYVVVPGLAFTQSKVESPSNLPRPSGFRVQYAADGQLSLDIPGMPASIPNSVVEEGVPLYGILIHGPDELDYMRPAFMCIGLPDSSYSKYVATFDLLAHSRSFQLIDSTPIQIEPAQPKLRISRKKRREDTGA